jgi:predicted nuclease of predicted toxin-antitoxin system
MKPVKFLCNENIPRASVELLISDGQNISYVARDLSGITDMEVIQLSIKEERIIITLDKDYGELIFKHGLKLITGIIYLRFLDYDPELPARMILSILRDSKITFAGKFTVIDPNGIRQRNL